MIDLRSEQPAFRFLAIVVASANSDLELRDWKIGRPKIGEQNRICRKGGVVCGFRSHAVNLGFPRRNSELKPEILWAKDKGLREFHEVTSRMNATCRPDTESSKYRHPTSFKTKRTMDRWNCLKLEALIRGISGTTALALSGQNA
jgi:hypothetical protein